MSQSTTPPIENAVRHTAIIREPMNMFSKLAWDADVFREIQVDYPDEREPLAFAAINVCISAWSLSNSTEKATWEDDGRLEGISFQGCDKSHFSHQSFRRHGRRWQY